ncbi:MAG: alpha/beta hydrolase family protein [Bryobacteraceae bacterium]
MVSKPGLDLEHGRDDRPSPQPGRQSDLIAFDAPMLMLSRLCLAIAIPLAAQPLPNTLPLERSGDIAAAMVKGIDQHVRRLNAESIRGRKPTRDALKKITGVIDSRVPFSALDLVATTFQPAVRHDGAKVEVTAVRWPVLPGVTAEGLRFRPKGRRVARVIALPDADQDPENLKVAWLLANNGCDVLVPVLTDRNSTWSGNPAFRFTNQSHREFIYRMAFALGRHIIGYEIQKVLAAVDWFAQQPETRIGIWGGGEGGLIALYAAALDSRIDAGVVSGYFQSRQGVAREPIYRNVWGLLKDFGDAEMAALMAPRRLLVETAPGPDVPEPSESDRKRRGAAPGELISPAPESARKEAERARALGATVEVSSDATVSFLRALGIAGPVLTTKTAFLKPVDRRRRQFDELVNYTQRAMRTASAVREDLWSNVNTTSVDTFRDSAKQIRRHFYDEVIGRPPPSVPMNPRTRLSYRSERWNGYEVTLDVYPEVFAYGVLLLPKDLKPGKRRPVVVVQHGLEGRAQSMFGLKPNESVSGNRDYNYYINIGSVLADQGFIVYAPQNPYLSPFRQIARVGNPLKLTLYSYISVQTQRLLDWLESLPWVDPKRIGYYGLSYGGKTAVRIPALHERFALSICSGDFDEWIVTISTVDLSLSYVFTGEYEIPEFNLGGVANHAEMAWMIFPRPFMVERGHRDGGSLDEWVSFEYARVRRLYDEMGLGDRSRIEYFNGPHKIRGQGTVEFLREHLNWK